MLLKTKLAASLLIASALAATPVLAGTEAGDAVVRAQVSIESQDNSDSFRIGAGGSIFLTDGFELGLDIATSYREDSFGSSTSETTTFGLGLSGTYNFFTDATVVPFIGIGLTVFTTETEIDTGSSFTSTDDDFELYDVFGGARFFVAENAALRLELRESGAIDSDIDFDRTVLSLGIELFF